MPTRSFQAETQHTGTRLWWWVRVYDTADELREACHRHHPWYGRPYWDGCFGVHQPGPFRETLVGNGSWAIKPPPNGLMGVIRLCRERLQIEAIAHEATHAALYAYRATKARNVRLGDECGPREETLCYLVGELVDSILGQI